MTFHMFCSFQLFFVIFRYISLICERKKSEGWYRLFSLLSFPFSFLFSGVFCFVVVDVLCIKLFFHPPPPPPSPRPFFLLPGLLFLSMSSKKKIHHLPRSFLLLLPLYFFFFFSCFVFLGPPFISTKWGFLSQFLFFCFFGLCFVFLHLCLGPAVTFSLHSI